MYKSPINIVEKAVQSIMEQREDCIYASVQDAFDVHVDKEELIRALRYDRDQYEKGYMDGKADAKPRWIPVSEMVPEAGKTVLCYTKGFGYWVASWDDCGDNMWSDGEFWCNKCGVTHWMPLPERPNQ